MEMWVSSAQNNVTLQSDMSWLYYVELTYSLIKVEDKLITKLLTIKAPGTMIFLKKLH